MRRAQKRIFSILTHLVGDLKVRYSSILSKLHLYCVELDSLVKLLDSRNTEKKSGRFSRKKRVVSSLLNTNPPVSAPTWAVSHKFKSCLGKL